MSTIHVQTEAKKRLGRPPRPPPPKQNFIHPVCVSFSSSVIVNYNNVSRKCETRKNASCESQVMLRDTYECPSTASAIYFGKIANNNEGTRVRDEKIFYQEQCVSMWVVEDEEDEEEKHTKNDDLGNSRHIHWT